jgi:L-lysine 2,3-aminomutase
LDPVSGAAHFDMPLKKAKQLHDEMLACLPGYLVPKLVRDIEGKASKTSASKIN